MPDMLPPIMILIHNTFVAPGLVPTLGPAAFFNDAQVPIGFIDNSTFNVPSRVDSQGVNATVEGDFANFSVKSITSYRSLQSLTGFDLDNTPLIIGQVADDFDVKQFSQELQFLGSGFDDRLKWIFGLYYFTEEGLNLNQVEFSLIHFLSGSQVDNRSAAVFGQFTFDVTSRLHLTLGGRYTDERKTSIVSDECFNLPLGPATLIGGGTVACAQLQSVIDPKFAPLITPLPFIPLTSGSIFLPRGRFTKDIGEFTPHINVAYDWTDDLMTYVSYSEGFKSGGFVQRINAPQPPLPDPSMPPPPPPPPGTMPFVPLPFPFTELPSFDPEFAKVYEVGFKSTLFQGRVRLNGAAFYTDYTNLQITVFEGGGPITKNAAEASIKGFELEATALLGEHFVFTGGIGFLDAQYEDITALANEQPEITLQSQFVNTPKWQLSSSLSHEIFVSDLGQVVTRIDWSYRTQTQNDTRNTPELVQPGFHLVNVSASFISSNEKWKISLFIRNLTDATYLISGFDDPSQFGTVRGIFGRPREWGLRLDGNF